MAGHQKAKLYDCYREEWSAGVMDWLWPVSANDAKLIRRCPLDQIMAFALNF